MRLLDFFRSIRTQPHEWRPVHTPNGCVMRRQINDEWQERALSDAERREMEDDAFYFETPP